MSQSDAEPARLRPAQPVYPVMLTNMAGAQVVVVGGGVVAARKVTGLLAAEAAVTVIAPELGEELRALHEQGAFIWQPRPYQTGDLSGARLAFAATNARSVNVQVAEEAAGRHILCNVADDPNAGDFHVPAVHRADGMVIAVSSSGQSPRRATTLRNRIAQWLAQSESELLQMISSGLPPEVSERYTELGAKLHEETITPAEQQELLKLADQIELSDAERMENLILLAQLRGISVDALMAQLGISRPANA